MSRRMLFVLSVLVTLAIAPAARAATWNRVFISTTGNDTNNCSDPASPCRTFGGAQAQTNAGGEIIAMATGGYGQLNITQSVTINGPAGVVIFSNFPVTVNAPGATVVLRGLTIDGTGQTTDNGVNVMAVSILHVESCVITGFAGDYPNGSGIYFNGPGQLFVEDTLIRGNGVAGLFVTSSSSVAKVTIDRCRFQQNAFGVDSNGSSQVTVRDSVASGNVQALQAESGGELNVEQCLVANNGVGIFSFGAASTVRVSNCTITDNNTGLAAFAGALLSRGNNTVAGNTTTGSFTGPITGM
jgi:hypothetical protein